MSTPWRLRRVPPAAYTKIKGNGARGEPRVM
jgi:hypothetical protein